jgi:hypothetical protein
MSYIAKLGQEFDQYATQLTGQLLLSNQHPKSLSEMERQIREMLLKLGQFLLGAWLAMQEEPYPTESIPCPCGGQAQYEFRREGVTTDSPLCGHLAHCVHQVFGQGERDFPCRSHRDFLVMYFTQYESYHPKAIQSSILWGQFHPSSTNGFTSTTCPSLR